MMQTCEILVLIGVGAIGGMLSSCMARTIGSKQTLIIWGVGLLVVSICAYFIIE